jgi:hypothetical protein
MGKEEEEEELGDEEEPVELVYSVIPNNRMHRMHYSLLAKCATKI